MTTFLATPWVCALRERCWLCIGLVLVLLSTVPALSAELEVHKSYLEDPGGAKSLADVRHEPLTQFEGDLSKGYSKSTFWIRIDIANAPADEPLVLTVSPSYLENVALLSLGSASQPSSAGMAQWSSQGHPPFLEHAFLIPESPEPQTYWLRVSSRTSVVVDVEIAPLSTALVAETRRNFLSAFYIGCLAILIMVGLAIAYISDDPTTRVFPIYETVVLIFSINLFGYLGFLFGSHLSRDDLSLIHQLATVATTLAAGIFHSLFLRSVGASRSGLAIAVALIVVNVCEFMLIALGSVRLALHMNAYIALAYPIAFFGMAIALPKDRESDFPRSIVVLYYALFLLVIVPMAMQLLGFRPPFHYVFYGNVFHGLMSGALMLAMLVWRTLRIWERERQSGENLALAIDSAQLGIWSFDPKESSFSISEICRHHFGFPRDRATVSEQELISAVHPADRMITEDSRKGAVADGKDFSVKHRVVWPDGSVHWLYSRGRPYFSANKSLLRIDGVTIDISELIQLQENLEGLVQEKTEELKTANRILSEMTRRDALTGLYNRMACNERLAAEFEHARRTGDCYSVLMIDIDLFKLVNDRCGHAIGDEVLKMVSDTLSRDIRKYDFISRWGGEEFLVLLPSTNLEHACVVANKLRHALDSEEHPMAGKVHISVGIAMASPQDVDQNVSVMSADAALYEAKRTGRNRVVVNTALPGMPAAFARDA